MNAAKFEENLLDYLCGQCEPALKAEMDRAASEDASLAELLGRARARLGPLEELRDLPVPGSLLERSWKRVQDLFDQDIRQGEEPTIIPIWQRLMNRPELVGMAASILIAAGLFIMPALMRPSQLGSQQAGSPTHLNTDVGIYETEHATPMRNFNQLNNNENSGQYPIHIDLDSIDTEQP